MLSRMESGLFPSLLVAARKLDGELSRLWSQRRARRGGASGRTQRTSRSHRRIVRLARNGHTDREEQSFAADVILRRDAFHGAVLANSDQSERDDAPIAAPTLFERLLPAGVG